MRLKIGKWSIIINRPHIHSNAKLDHECLNGVMDGTYSCEYCYPPCKKCGRDTADFFVHCNKNGCQDHLIIKTGQKFKTSGYYRLINHHECFIPQQAYEMLFKKGETAPKSCEHVAEWQLFEEYNG